MREIAVEQTPMKRCGKCGEIKLLNEFTNNRTKKDGKQYGCKECEKQRYFEDESNRGELSRARSSRSYYRNKAKRLELGRRWRILNPDKSKEIGRRADEKRFKTPKGKLNKNISRSILASLRTSKNGRHWEELVGYTINELKEHLERLFKSGMTWENYGKWHIDHIIPKSKFNFVTPEDLDFKKCWALKNLQPLEAKQNMSKGNKFDNL